jgi:hypothetical protein
MSRYRQQRHEAEKKQKRRSSWQFLVLLALLIPTGWGAFQFFGSSALSNARSTTEFIGIAPSQETLQVGQNAGGYPSRRIPAKYNVKGTVDDQYTVAEDPDTGKTMIYDSLGGLGTNSTSVEGDRLVLARQMTELEQYAEDNRSKLSNTDYFWMKKVARTGMKLAFGNPGLPSDRQPALKKSVLADFYSISGNPSASLQRTVKYLALENVFQRPDAAYVQYVAQQQPYRPFDPFNYLAPDPLAPTTLAWNPYQSRYTLTGVLSTNAISPALSTLSTAPYATLSKPALTPIVLTNNITTTSTTPTKPTTVAGYYDAILQTNLAATTPTQPSGQTTLTTTQPIQAVTTPP